MDESAVTQNRRSRRSNVLLTATIEVGGRPHSVKLRNLSAEGALLEGDQLPIEGTEVQFVRKELSVAGRVIWASGKHAGISFNERLKPDVVLRHIPPPRPRMQPDFRRPGLACVEMSSDQRRLIESWFTTAPMSQLGE
jgi:hypothetical protein